MIEIISFICLMSAGYFIGQRTEKKHFALLDKREKAVEHIPVITSQWKDQVEDSDEAVFISMGTVVGSDYFKSFVSNLRNLVGGRMTAYESLLDRGRREAVVRVKEKASAMGCHKIVNLKVETSTLNSQSKRAGLPCMELFAYATALKKNSGNGSI